MAEVRISRPDDVEAFLDAAGDFLAAREAEHNLLFGICTAIRVTPELVIDEPPRFVVATDEAGHVRGASLRTPPSNQVLSEVDDPAAVDAMVDALRDEPLPGVLGPKDAAARFVAGWSDATGQAADLAVAERIFRLDHVIPPPRSPAGTWRVAAPADRDLIADWVLAFMDEAVPDDSPAGLDEMRAAVDRWIAGRYRRVYLWEAAGRVVSMVGAGGETPHGIRIGPVYTPPGERGRGYARALTAAVSQDQLDRGRRFCFLFTDLSNPASNKIYQQIGYRPVRDVDQYRFRSAHD